MKHIPPPCLREQEYDEIIAVVEANPSRPAVAHYFPDSGILVMVTCKDGVAQYWQFEGPASAAAAAETIEGFDNFLTTGQCLVDMHADSPAH